MGNKRINRVSFLHCCEPNDDEHDEHIDYLLTRKAHILTRVFRKALQNFTLFHF